jgi:hypothetical protein
MNDVGGNQDAWQACIPAVPNSRDAAITRTDQPSALGLGSYRELKTIEGSG